MPSLRDTVAAAIGGLPGSAVLRVLEAGDRGRSDRCLVLTYHRIDHPAARPDLWPNLVSATPAAFASQMEYVARHLHPIDMDRFLQALRNRGSLPRRSVLVTIDDAYADVAEHAWPTLRRLGIPATLFVPTAVVSTGGHFWWDRVHRALMRTPFPSLPWRGSALPLRDRAERELAVQRVHAEVRDASHDVAMRWVDRLEAAAEVPPGPRAVLTWDEIAAMAVEGLTVGGHTRTHPRLDRVSLGAGVDEITGSIDDLRTRLGRPIPPVLAYPSGDHGEPAPSAAREAGIVAAFTTERGAVDLRAADPLRLRRVNVGRRSSVNAIRLQAGSWMRLIGR